MSRTPTQTQTSATRAELRGVNPRAETVPPPHATVTAAWLGVSRKPDHGITFHDMRGGSDFRSYQELLADSLRLAAALRARGVKPGDRVALVLPTGPDFVLNFFASILVGAVPAPLYPPMTAQGMNAWKDRTRSLFLSLEPRLLVTAEKLREVFGELSADNPPPDYLGLVLPEELRAQGAGLDVTAADVAHPARPEEIAFIQFSSGTTVDPKPVVLSHRNLMENVIAIGKRYLEQGEFTRHNFNWLPLYHDMGLIGNVLVPVVWECKNELLPPQDFVARPWLWPQLLSRTGAVLGSAPNFAYHLVVQRVKDKHLEGVDLSNVKILLCGAEPINPDTIQAFEEKLAPYGLKPGTVLPAYGLSEVSLAATIGREGRGLETETFTRASLESGRAERATSDVDDTETVRLASGGYALDGMEIRIASVEDSGRLLAPGEIGEILARGGSVCEGYLSPDGVTLKAAASGEWLATGDLGFIFEDRLFISGRKKDLIIRNGRNIYPQHLEETISKVEGVRDGICAAASRSLGAAEEVYLFFELSGGAEEAPGVVERVRDDVRREHALGAEHVIALEKHSIPRTTSGKIRRAQTLKLFLDGELRALGEPS